MYEHLAENQVSNFKEDLVCNISFMWSQWKFIKNNKFKVFKILEVNIVGNILGICTKFSI